MALSFNVFKKIWRFLADIAGVVSAVSYVVISIRPVAGKIAQLYLNNKPMVALAASASLFASYLLLSILWDRLVAVWEVYRKERINEGLTYHRNEVLSPFKIKDLVPSSKILSDTYNFAKEETSRWSNDAQITSFNLYLRQSPRAVEFMDPSISVQVYAVSKWRNEELVLYFPRNSRTNKRASGIEFAETAPFFQIKNWDKAVMAAYEKISSTVTNGFNMQISSDVHLSSERDPNDYGELSINISYQVGALEERRSFVFNGSNLKCNEDGSITPVI